MSAELIDLRRQLDDALALIDAVKVLLYTDEVYVGSHWEGDFRDPATKVWPVFCAFFSNYGADGEEIPVEQIVPLAALVRQFGSDAVSAWVCHRRDLAKPPKGRLTEKGEQALAFLREQVKADG